MTASVLEAPSSHNPAFVGKPLDPCAGPHKPPNMLDPWMTKYDYDYNKGVVPSTFTLLDTESGFCKNRPLFARHPTDDWDSVEHRAYRDLRTRGLGMVPNQSELQKILIAAAEPHVLSTAYIRGTLSKAGCPYGDPTTISTYKDHYPEKWTVPGSSGPFAGAKANAYNPQLLAIDTPDDDGVGKPVRRGPKRAHAADGNIISDGGRMPSKRPQDTLTVFGPGALDKLEGETEYSTIGNPKLFKKSLLPRNIDDLDDDYDKSEKNKKKLLDMLAGRYRPHKGGDHYPELLDTNPIPMGLKEEDVCRVARRHELEGPVNVTTHKSDFRRQERLPELCDGPRDRGKSGASVYITRHMMPPPRPLHPTKKLCEEKHERQLGPDRHVHKYHKYSEKKMQL